MESFPLDKYALPAVVTVAGMHQYIRFAKAVGAARRKCSVKVPDTDGPPEFVRTFRAHQNTLEFYPLSLSGLWIGSLFFHPIPATLFYEGYLIGRELYFRGYVESEEKRMTGFRISTRCLMGLFALCALGTGHKLIRYYGDIDLWKMICDNLPIGQN